MTTILLSAVIFGAAAYAVYVTYIKKGSQGSCGCSDCHCKEPIKK